MKKEIPILLTGINQFDQETRDALFQSGIDVPVIYKKDRRKDNLVIVILLRIDGQDLYQAYCASEQVLKDAANGATLLLEWDMPICVYL